MTDNMYMTSGQFQALKIVVGMTFMFPTIVVLCVLLVVGRIQKLSHTQYLRALASLYWSCPTGFQAVSQDADHAIITDMSATSNGTLVLDVSNLCVNLRSRSESIRVDTSRFLFQVHSDDDAPVQKLFAPTMSCFLAVLQYLSTCGISPQDVLLAVTSNTPVSGFHSVTPSPINYIISSFMEYGRDQYQRTTYLQTLIDTVKLCNQRLVNIPQEFQDILSTSLNNTMMATGHAYDDGSNMGFVVPPPPPRTFVSA